MKLNRSQKKRNKNNAVTTIRKLTEQYGNIVNNHFIFKEWIEAMTPKEDSIDARIDQTIRYFITQTLVYVNIFLREYEGKKCIIIKKEDVLKAFKENEIYDRFEYDESVTKETIMNVLDKCVELFFNNTIFPVIDINEEEVKDEPSA